MEANSFVEIWTKKIVKTPYSFSKIFKWRLKNGPFDIRTGFNHLNTRLDLPTWRVLLKLKQIFLDVSRRALCKRNSCHTKFFDICLSLCAAGKIFLTDKYFKNI